jgi:hypothetical protein
MSTSFCIYDDSQIKKRSNIRTPCGLESDHQSSWHIHIGGKDKGTDSQKYTHQERERERERERESQR